jgi:hypothetical protein
MNFSQALKTTVAALATTATGENDKFDALRLEVAVLDRSRAGRTFRRLSIEQIDKLLNEK